MRHKFTAEFINSLKGPRGKPRETYWDADPRGFGLRVTAKGVKTWVALYRHGRRLRWLKIGIYPVMPLADARIAAKEALLAAQKGGDPAGDKQAARSAGSSMAYLAELWMEHARKKQKRTADADQKLIDFHVMPALSHIPVAAVQFGDIDRLHSRISKTAPIQANRVLALCNAMFRLSEKHKMRPPHSNPCADVVKNPEQKRRKYLSRAGTPAFLDAVERHSDPRVRLLVKFLLATGARRGETMAATFNEFTTDPATGATIWTKPSAHTKQKMDHVVPLNSEAAAIFRELEAGRGTSNYLFPGDKPDSHITDIKKSWATICKAAGLEDFHLHDLRHSFGSALVARGVSLSVIGALLGHTQPDTTARYAHVDVTALLTASEKLIEFLPPRKEAADG